MKVLIVNVLGAAANLSSLILWIPQARTTWKNRNNLKALQGISIGTQLIVVVNTILWCIYGISIKNVWLPLGTIIILPLASLTIFLKIKQIRVSKDSAKESDETRPWFKFSYFRKLDKEEKQACLKAMYTTDFINQVCYEIVNWESVESMSNLEKMYWDKDLFLEKMNDFS